MGNKDVAKVLFKVWSKKLESLKITTLLCLKKNIFQIKDHFCDIFLKT